MSSSQNCTAYVQEGALLHAPVAMCPWWKQQSPSTVASALAPHTCPTVPAKADVGIMRCRPLNLACTVATAGLMHGNVKYIMRYIMYCRLPYGYCGCASGVCMLICVPGSKCRMQVGVQMCIAQLQEHAPQGSTCRR